MTKKGRSPEIVADAASYILKRSSKECTANFFIDDEVLSSEGITDLDSYAIDLRLGYFFNRQIRNYQKDF